MVKYLIKDLLVSELNKFWYFADQEPKWNQLSEPIPTYYSCHIHLNKKDSYNGKTEKYRTVNNNFISFTVQNCINRLLCTFS